MVLVIKKGASVKEIKKLMGAKKSKKGLNAKKYLGIIKLKEDALEIQKRMRGWKPPSCFIYY
jgi:hypothetical protein